MIGIAQVLKMAPEISDADLQVIGIQRLMADTVIQQNDGSTHLGWSPHSSIVAADGKVGHRDGAVTNSPMAAADRRHIIDDTLVGWLESPSPLSTVTRARTVSGWIFSTSEPITHLVAR